MNGFLDKKDWYSIAKVELSAYLQVSVILVAVLGVFSFVERGEIGDTSGKFILLAIFFLFVEILIVMYAIRNERKIAFFQWKMQKRIVWRQNLDNFLRSTAFFILVLIAVFIFFAIYNYLGFSIVLEFNWTAIGAISTFFAALVALFGPFIYRYFKDKNDFNALLKSLEAEIYFNYDQLFSSENRGFNFEVFNEIRERHFNKVVNEEIFFQLQRLYAELSLFYKEKESANAQVWNIQSASFSNTLSLMEDKEILDKKDTFISLVDIIRSYEMKYQISAINKFLEFFSEDEKVDYSEDTSLEKLRDKVDKQVAKKTTFNEDRREKINNKIEKIFKERA